MSRCVSSLQKIKLGARGALIVTLWADQSQSALVHLMPKQPNQLWDIMSPGSVLTLADFVCQWKELWSQPAETEGHPCTEGLVPYTMCSCFWKLKDPGMLLSSWRERGFHTLRTRKSASKFQSPSSLSGRDIHWACPTPVCLHKQNNLAPKEEVQIRKMVHESTIVWNWRNKTHGFEYMGTLPTMQGQCSQN